MSRKAGRIPLTAKERSEVAEQRRLLAEHLRITARPGYRRAVERARAAATAQWRARTAPTQDALEQGARDFESALRAEHERLIQAEVSRWRIAHAPKLRRMGAREARAKIRAWGSIREASQDLHRSEGTLRRWMRDGVPAAAAAELRAEHARIAELNAHKAAIVAAAKKALKQVPRDPEGEAELDTYRRAGRQITILFPYEPIAEKQLSKLKKQVLDFATRSNYHYWQGVTALALVLRGSEVDEARYGAAGAANYARSLAIIAPTGGEALDDDLFEVLVDIPIQTRYHDTAGGMLDELEAGIREAWYQYGVGIMLDVATISNFEFKPHG